MAEMASEEQIGLAEDDEIGLPSQGRIKELYYKAIQDAKLGDRPNTTEQDPGPPGYPTDDFTQWARKIDIYTLDKGAADFAIKKT